MDESVRNTHLSEHRNWNFGFDCGLLPRAGEGLVKYLFIALLAGHMWTACAIAVQAGMTPQLGVALAFSVAGALLYGTVLIVSGKIEE